MDTALIILATAAVTLFLSVFLRNLSTGERKHPGWTRLAAAR